MCLGSDGHPDAHILSPMLPSALSPSRLWSLTLGFAPLPTLQIIPRSFDTHFWLLPMLRKVLSWFGLEYVGSSSREEQSVDPPELNLPIPRPTRPVDPRHSFYPYTHPGPSLPTNPAAPSHLVTPHGQPSREAPPQDYGSSGSLPPPYPFAWPYAAGALYPGMSPSWPTSPHNFPPWLLGYPSAFVPPPSHSSHPFDPSNVPPSHVPKHEVPIPPIPHSKPRSVASKDSDSLIPTRSRMAQEPDVSRARSSEAAGNNGGQHRGHSVLAVAQPDDALADSEGAL